MPKSKFTHAPTVTITRRDGAPTVTTSTSSDGRTRFTTFGERTYAVVSGGRVTRSGSFAAASEAFAKLNPVAGEESLFVEIPR